MSSRKRILLLLASSFILSRIFLRISGVVFDSGTLQVFWQFLDPEILAGDLLSSLFYLHSQPPLFNLFLGVILKISAGHSDLIFYLIYLVIGFLGYLTVFCLLLRLDVPLWWAYVISSLFVIQPAYLLLENWLMYDLPVIVVLNGCALLLVRSLEHPSFLRWGGFFGCLSLLPLMRSFFHPGYFFAVLMILLLVFHRNRGVSRILFVGAVGPAILLVGLLVKNQLLFNFFGSSSWVGMNLARIVTAPLTPGQLKRMSREEQLSEVACIPPFSPLEAYPEKYREQLLYPSIRCLSAPRKTTGAVNFNNESYLRISRDSMADALRIAAEHPSIYLRGVAKAIYNFSKPLAGIQHLAVNTQRMGAYRTFSDSLFYLRLPWTLDYRGEEKEIFLGPILAVPGLFLYGIWLVAGDTRLKHKERVLLIFMCCTIAYVTLIGCTCEVWENQRFRSYIDPFLIVLMGLWLYRLRAQVFFFSRPHENPQMGAGLRSGNERHP